MKNYLLLDDQGSRGRTFANQIQCDEIRVEILYDPAELREVEDLPDWDGAIIDFHLNPPTYSRYNPLLCRSYPGAPDVPVRTGMGAMLYFKEHAPDVPLFGQCELTAMHSQLFLAAAWAWIGATPLNAATEPDVIRQILENESRSNLQAVHSQVACAEAPFVELMDCNLNQEPQEAYEWFQFLRTCQKGKNTVAGLQAVRTARYPERQLVDPTNTYYKMMTRWQTALAKFVVAFEGDTSTWPNTTAPRAETWRDNNPVLDFVKNAGFDQFFTERDVRAALDRYRWLQREGQAER